MSSTIVNQSNLPNRFTQESDSLSRAERNFGELESGEKLKNVWILSSFDNEYERFAERETIQGLFRSISALKEGSVRVGDLNIDYMLETHPSGIKYLGSASVQRINSLNYQMEADDKYRDEKLAQDIKSYGKSRFRCSSDAESRGLESHVQQSVTSVEEKRSLNTRLDIQRIKKRLKSLVTKVANNPNLVYPDDIENMRERYGSSSELLEIVDRLEEHVQKHEDAQSARKYHSPPILGRIPAFVQKSIEAQMGIYLPDNLTKIQFANDDALSEGLDLILNAGHGARLTERGDSYWVADGSLELLKEHRIEYKKL
ncbi:hypothetical protein [Gimesia panareensis]|uniref:hypothetical protein n=1 Tax=Gimesia panareensis TaxID=2527978 RepID=UPI001188B70E|nr:hypothetical protein [Gimesia panareensis]QDU52124.1 hypothetical protein Pan110_44960 [Gimesia panareensis]